MSSFSTFVKAYLQQHDPQAFYKLQEEEAKNEIIRARIPAPATDIGKLCELYTEEELKYMVRRKEEFCADLGKIFYECLQPGYAKFGTIVHAGSCPFYIFD